jgi:hypothetical protein
MGAYDELLKDKLREMCDSRGLPVSGNKDELIARLEDDDDAQKAVDSDSDDLLDGIDDPSESHGEPPGGPDPGDATPSPIEDDGEPPEPPADDEPGPVAADKPAERPRWVDYPYPCPGELTNEAHYGWIHQSRQDALQAGLNPRGGGYRERFEVVGGIRHAVYRVLLRRG